MPHPLPFRVKALVILCTRHYALQPPLRQFISYTSTLLLTLSSSHKDSHTLERLPFQDLCIGCLFYPEHSFLIQPRTATTSKASSTILLPQANPLGSPGTIYVLLLQPNMLIMVSQAWNCHCSIQSDKCLLSVCSVQNLC